MATQDFKIRAALSGDIAAIGEIVALSWQRTIDGLVAPEFLASLSAEQQASRHTRAFARPETIYRVATTSGSEVIGFASGGPGRDHHTFYGAELYAIYLRPGFERRGIGRALFRAVAAELMEMSPQGFYLTALAVNPSRQFYRKMGGRELAVPDVQLGSDFYPQVGFVWTDVPAG